MEYPDYVGTIKITGKNTGINFTESDAIAGLVVKSDRLKTTYKRFIDKDCIKTKIDSLVDANATARHEVLGLDF